MSRVLAILTFSMLALHAGENEPVPDSIRQFVGENLKGCEVLSSRAELKTNAVLARLMSDLYKSRYEYHFEMRDARGETFKVRLQDSIKIERLDSCKVRVADLPPAVQKRLVELGAGVNWDETCEAGKESARFVKYELRGRKDNRKIRATFLHDGTVVSFPGMKDERPRAAAAPLSPAAPNPFIENALISPRE